MKKLFYSLIVFFFALIIMSCKPSTLEVEVYTSDIESASEGEIVEVPIKATFSLMGEDKENQLGFSGLFTASSGLKPVVWIGIGLAVFQQLVGINVVFYYGAVLWQAVGFTESDALLINIISGGLSILACFRTCTWS